MAEQSERLGGMGRIVHIRKDPYEVYIGRGGKGTVSKWPFEPVGTAG